MMSKSAAYLNILNKGSDVQERYLDRSSHLLIGCIHEYFQGINPIVVVLSQFIYFICSCILPMKQRKTVSYLFENLSWCNRDQDHYSIYSRYICSKGIYMFDFDKQLPPSPVQKEKLLLQIPWDCVIAGLNEKVPCIVHVHVLLHPMREVSEEILKEKRKERP